MSTTSILDRFLEPVVEFLPAEAAQKIIDLRIDPELQSRLDQLAEKANQGSLSVDERAEYERYVEELDVIAIFKRKARAALRRQQA
jgi:predicted DNA-binding protein